MSIMDIEVLSMTDFELANRIFDCISDGYDDEELREEAVEMLTGELSVGTNGNIKAAFNALCERIEELEL